MALPPESTELVRQDVFYLHGLLWLPHYKLEGMFVGPGFKHPKTRETLVLTGATLSTRMLWKRPYYK